MAYNEFLADRIRIILSEKHIPFTEKKMMGGWCVMLFDKMLLGLVREELMARIGLDTYEEALKKEGVNKMTFTGRAMKGYVFVQSEVLLDEESLNYWIDLCILFNPKAKSSKKR